MASLLIRFNEIKPRVNIISDARCDLGNYRITILVFNATSNIISVKKNSLKTNHHIKVEAAHKELTTFLLKAKNVFLRKRTINLSSLMRTLAMFLLTLL